MLAYLMVLQRGVRTLELRPKARDGQWANLWDAENCPYASGLSPAAVKWLLLTLRHMTWTLIVLFAQEAS